MFAGCVEQLAQFTRASDWLAVQRKHYVAGLDAERLDDLARAIARVVQA